MIGGLGCRDCFVGVHGDGYVQLKLLCGYYGGFLIVISIVSVVLWGGSLLGVFAQLVSGRIDLVIHVC